jgi:hypothetical protein
MDQMAPFNSPRLRASARTFSFGSDVVGKANSRSSAFSSEAGGKYSVSSVKSAVSFRMRKTLRFPR